MTGMFQCRDIVSPGTINLGTRGPRTFVRVHIVSGRPVTPPFHRQQISLVFHFYTCSVDPVFLHASCLFWPKKLWISSTTIMIIMRRYTNLTNKERVDCLKAVRNFLFSFLLLPLLNTWTRLYRTLKLPGLTQQNTVHTTGILKFS